MSQQLETLVIALIESRGNDVLTVFGDAATVGIDEIEALKRFIHHKDSKLPIISEKKVSQSEACKEVFSHWLLVMGKSEKACRLNPKRKAKIVARLNDGYSVGDIKSAIDGCARSRYHMGDNPNGTVYNSIELILRDGDKLEYFRDNVGVAQAPKMFDVHSGGNCYGSKKMERSSREIPIDELATDRSWAQ